MKSKSLLLICTFIFTFGSVFSQADLYYWGYKTKYPLTADSLNVVLIPKDKNSNIAMRDLMNSADFEKSSSLSGRKELLLKVRHKSVLKNQISTEFDLLPVFKYGDYPLVPTGEIVFQPKIDIDYDQIRTYCNNQISLVKQSKYGTFTIKPTDINDLIKLSNQIYESGLVEWCEPNFLIEIVKHQVVTPTDPLYLQQYYLNQTNNIDINAPEAWGLSTGINNVIRVAVIDDGVEAHEDFNGRVVQGFTPLDPNGQGAPTNNLPPAAEGIIGHGQAVAGIIGATHDNIGIAGVSPYAQIVPVNIFNNWFLDSNFPVGQRLRWLETPEDIAEAINWAWDPNFGNADVLSNSWGYGTSNPNAIPQSGQIIQAIR